MVTSEAGPSTLKRDLPPPKASSLARSGRGLVDLTRALGRVRGAKVDRGAALVELKVPLGSVLDDVDQVLGVAGVTDALYAHTLVGVVATTGDRERLIEVGALGLLLGLLADLRDGRYGGHGDHRQ